MSAGVAIRALLAPDSLKGTLPAPAIAEALAAGVRDAGVEADACPVADGGEGTLDVLINARGGSRLPVEVPAPLGDPVQAHVGLFNDGRTAIVEMAEASGLALAPSARRDPERGSSAGTGELLLAAVRAGARKILVAVGGRATTDGGIGAIAAIKRGGGLGWTVSECSRHLGVR